MSEPSPESPFRGGFRVVAFEREGEFAVEAWGGGLDEVLPRLLEGAARGHGGDRAGATTTLHTFAVRAPGILELVSEVATLGLRYGVVQAVADDAPDDVRRDVRAVLRAHVAETTPSGEDLIVDPRNCSLEQADGLWRARVEVRAPGE